MNNCSWLWAILTWSTTEIYMYTFFLSFLCLDRQVHDTGSDCVWCRVPRLFSAAAEQWVGLPGSGHRHERYCSFLWCSLVPPTPHPTPSPNCSQILQCNGLDCLGQVTDMKGTVLFPDAPPPLPSPSSPLPLFSPPPPLPSPSYPLPLFSTPPSSPLPLFSPPPLLPSPLLPSPSSPLPLLSPPPLLHSPLFSPPPPLHSPLLSTPPSSPLPLFSPPPLLPSPSSPLPLFSPPPPLHSPLLSPPPPLHSPLLSTPPPLHSPLLSTPPSSCTLPPPPLPPLPWYNHPSWLGIKHQLTYSTPPPPTPLTANCSQLLQCGGLDCLDQVTDMKGIVIFCGVSPKCEPFQPFHCCASRTVTKNDQ